VISVSSSPGALLLLLLAVYLLLAFFTGRLEWLFSMARDVQAGYHAGAAGAPGMGGPVVVPPAGPPVQSAALMPNVTGWDPRFYRYA
jgi:hypothetical protein